MVAAYDMITKNYCPMSVTPLMIQFNIILILMMVACSLVVFAGALKKVFFTLKKGTGYF